MIDPSMLKTQNSKKFSESRPNTDMSPKSGKSSPKSSSKIEVVKPMKYNYAERYLSYLKIVFTKIFLDL